MRGSWVLFTQIVIGPLCLGVAAGFEGWPRAVMLIVGSLATLAGFVLTQRGFAKAAGRSTAEGILDTAVEFLHASGVRQVRANFMAVGTSGALSMVYKSQAYRRFETDNSWKKGDGSCASRAVELRVPVLGGYPGEFKDIDVEDAPFRVDVTEMVALSGEKTRAVLCVPVSRAHSDPVGVITFDDTAPLRVSRLKDPAILIAVKALADSWLDTVP